MNFRIGFGHDVHRLAAGQKLILGGIEIPHKKGTIAHSDGDVLVHAICDALLGAANLRDIGVHFPDTSDEFKGVSSLMFLKKVMDLLKKEHYSVVNLDTTICLQQPKIKDYTQKITEKLAFDGLTNIKVICDGIIYTNGCSGFHFDGCTSSNIEINCISQDSIDDIAGHSNSLAITWALGMYACKTVDCNNMEVKIKLAKGYAYGFYIAGLVGGNSYGKNYINRIQNCKYGLYLYSESTGWVSQHEFYGGRF